MSTTSSQADSFSGQSATAFAASLVTSVAVFLIEVAVFLLIKDRFSRIYLPRTYLVPERERTTAPPAGYVAWAIATLQTSHADFVQKAGLDAYFFLRYLQTLLKIFVPAALVIIPILIPLNAVGGRGENWAREHPGQASVSGMDVLAWSNVRPDHADRYWAHWLLAVGLVAWVCYVAFDELRGYIRIRQDYMTSPQHRLRASAATVLVSSIPTKWCSVEALSGLYDVFPAGIRNIWVNRDFDELADKIEKRDELSAQLESAETDLIKKCFKKQAERAARSELRAHKEAKTHRQGCQSAYGEGVASGSPHLHHHHHHHHNVREVIHGTNDHRAGFNGDGDEEQHTKSPRAIFNAMISKGLDKTAKSLGNMGRGMMDGIKVANKGLNEIIDTTNGFIHPEHAQNLPVGADDRFHYQRRPGGFQGDGSAWGHSGGHSGGHSRGHSKGHSRGLSRGGVMAPSMWQGQNCSTWDRKRTYLASDHDRQLWDPPIPISSSDAEPNIQSENTPPSKKNLRICKSVGRVGGDRNDSGVYESAYNAYDEELATDPESATWREYLDEQDRDTMRLPIAHWLPSLPLVGEKVDTIYHCRKELARLNMEIEDDQAHPERFPLMNSAFVQFHQQVAAHMACQTVSHHIPKQMAPRVVEIDPNDVIWDNLSMPWWQMYLRTAIVIATIGGMLSVWAFPVAFTGSLSQLQTLAHQVTWLRWIFKVSPVLVNLIQGVLPAVVLSLLMWLLPVILRLLITFQGAQSGNLVELSVQQYYFCFLFVQLFLVVTISGAATTLISFFADPKSISSIPNLLATNIPKASNYFFAYMLLQALSTSAGALLQVGSLIGWFILAPLLDSTARQKFQRRTALSDIQWGTFFPVYTNLACIGLIYSVISPLILIFNIITFSLFWFVYRYNTLYVTRFTRDTGGLLYPNAINTTFTGVYVLEIVLIGLFFLVRDGQGKVACTGQAVGMIVILILTAGYQWLLNRAFAPLFKYLPITLEDDAVRRDEEFARAMHQKHGGMVEGKIHGDDLDGDHEGELEHDEPEQDELEQDELEQDELEQDELEQDEPEQDEPEQDELEQSEQRKKDNHDAEEYVLQQIHADQRKQLQQPPSPQQVMPPLRKSECRDPEIILHFGPDSKSYHMLYPATHSVIGKIWKRLNVPPAGYREGRGKPSGADRDSPRHRTSEHFDHEPGTNSGHGSASPETQKGLIRGIVSLQKALDKFASSNPIGRPEDLEAQRTARNQLSEALFAGVTDELEDLTADEREVLVQRAFQHSALRATRPVIWLPRDEMGVSDDEIRRIAAFSQNLWLSNDRQGLDSKGRCIYSGPPPDFDPVDLILF